MHLRQPKRQNARIGSVAIGPVRHPRRNLGRAVGYVLRLNEEPHRRTAKVQRRAPKDFGGTIAEGGPKVSVGARGPFWGETRLLPQGLLEWFKPVKADIEGHILAGSHPFSQIKSLIRKFGHNSVAFRDIFMNSSTVGLTLSNELCSHARRCPPRLPTALALSGAFGFPRRMSAETMPSVAYGFDTDRDTKFVRQILAVPERRRKPNVGRYRRKNALSLFQTDFSQQPRSSPKRLSKYVKEAPI